MYMFKKVINKSNTKKNILIASAVAIVALGGATLYIRTNLHQNDSSQSEKVTKAPGTSTAYDAYAAIPRKDIAQILSDGEIGWDTRDPYFGFDTLPITAVVHIDSIDGGRTYKPITGNYGYAETFGKMTILSVYKGDIKPGQQLHYSRGGGIVTYNNYWNALNDEQKDKRLHLNNGEKNPTGIKYVEQKFSDDIDIEAGKTYLVFMRADTYKDGSLIEYSIAGMQYGLRKVEGTGPDMKVYNNSTETWESLSSVVKSH